MITDYNEILKIARNSLKEKDVEKLKDIDPRFKVIGLYPNKIKKLWKN